MSEFEGKVAVVTGGASGIGRAVAKELAAGGASVVVTDISQEGAQAVAEEITSAGGAATACVADAAKPEDNEAMVSFAVSTYGALHLAVNNAGIGGPPQKIGEYDIATWDRVRSVDLDGVFYGMRYEIPAMQAAGSGSIVNVASVMGAVGIAQNSAYVTAKHGLIGLAKAAALEYSAEGIRTNTVGPGFIDTPLLRSSMSPEALDGIAAEHATQRLGTDEEVAALVVFLLSDRASFITGSYHLVDGGYTAH